MGEPTMTTTSVAAYLRGCVMYLCLFMGYGCTDPFMPLIWRIKGISKHQIGLLGAVSPVSLFFVTPIMCAFAEKYGVQQKMLYMALLVYTISRPTVLMAESFLTVVAVEVSCAIGKSPVSSLIDTAIRETSGADGFGAQRLWGAVGFGVTAVVAGILYDADDGGCNGVMFLFVAAMLGAMMASTGISLGSDCKLDKNIEDFYPNATDDSGPSTTIAIAEKRERAGEASRLTAVASVHYDAPGREPAIQKRFIKDENAKKSSDESGPQDDENNTLLTILLLILGTAENASFFLAIVLSGMAAGVIETFLFIRVEELGGTRLLCGLARLIMSLSEIPFFYFSGGMMRCIGVRGMMALAQTAYLARLLYYSVLENPSWVLPVEVLHGFTYAAMWTASLEHAHNIAPESLRTTMRGVVGGLHWGLGFGFGAVLGGILYSDLGPRLCFRASAMLPLMSLSLLVLPAVRWWCNKWGKMRNIDRDLNDTFCDMEQCKDCKICHLQDESYGSEPCDKADDGNGGFGRIYSIREDGKKLQQWRQQLLPQQQ